MCPCFFILQVILTAVTGLTNAVFAVFNGFCRAIADAGHAMGAVISPDGNSILQPDIV